MPEKSPALGRSLLLCLLIGWLGVYASLLSTVSDRLAQQFSLVGTDAGMFISSHAAGMLVSVLISGTLADSLGKRRIVIASCGLIVMGMLITYFAASLPMVMAGLFITGMGFSPSEAISSALLTDENPQNATGWMNLSQVFFGLGAILSPLAVMGYLASGSDKAGIKSAISAHKTTVISGLPTHLPMRTGKRELPAVVNSIITANTAPLRRGSAREANTNSIGHTAPHPAP